LESVERLRLSTTNRVGGRELLKVMMLILK